MTGENYLTFTSLICNPSPLFPNFWWSSPWVGEKNLSNRVENTNDMPKTLYLLPSTFNGTS